MDSYFVAMASYRDNDFLQGSFFSKFHITWCLCVTVAFAGRFISLLFMTMIVN